MSLKSCYYYRIAKRIYSNERKLTEGKYKDKQMPVTTIDRVNKALISISLLSRALRRVCIPRTPLWGINSCTSYVKLDRQAASIALSKGSIQLRVLETEMKYTGLFAGYKKARLVSCGV